MVFDKLDPDNYENDIHNLCFLLSASPETLQDWFDKMTEDDLEYAVELLENASAAELSALFDDTITLH